MAIITGTNHDDFVSPNPAQVTPGVSGPATQGNDQISTGNGNDTVFSAFGNDQVQGGNGEDDLRAGPGDDTVDGGNGNDRLDVEDGNDVLNAGRGDDWVHGGFGADVLTGGDGADTFAFGTIPGREPVAQIDTGVGQGARDVIRDFEQGSDVIDLRSINFIGEHVGGPPGNQTTIPGSDFEFEFIGTSEFTAGGGNAPQLRYEVVKGQTILQMDGIRISSGTYPQPDGLVDAEIALIGEFVLRDTNFFL